MIVPQSREATAVDMRRGLNTPAQSIVNLYSSLVPFREDAIEQPALQFAKNIDVSWNIFYASYPSSQSEKDSDSMPPFNFGTRSPSRRDYFQTDEQDYFHVLGRFTPDSRGIGNPASTTASLQTPYKPDFFLSNMYPNPSGHTNPTEDLQSFTPDGSSESAYGIRSLLLLQNVAEIKLLKVENR